MALPTNVLQNVVTYNKAELAFLQNSYAFLSISNKKFDNFQNITGQLGDTVSFDLPPRYYANDGLTINLQASEQRKQSLTVDKSKNIGIAFDDKQLLFNVKDYMNTFGKSAVAEIGAVVEKDVASVILSSTYRHYGNGITAISSEKQLADILAQYRNFGAPAYNTECILPDINVPAIINNNLTQFALARNNREAASWEIGDFARSAWYESNLLPIQYAGVAGETQSTLTVASVTTDADGGISAITFSGLGSTTGAVKENDVFEFQDAVAGQTDVRFRTFIGHHPCNAKVQFRATADADSVGDALTITISPKLYVADGRNQNITTAIVAGMEVVGAKTHRAGLVMAGKPLYCAMPKLPDTNPYDSAVAQDPDSGASMRLYYGFIPAPAEGAPPAKGLIRDVIYGYTLVPEYAFRICFPLNPS